MATLGTLVLSIAFAAKGLRGTDQYWYAADLINSGTLGSRSNTLYPSFALTGATRDASALPPRIHEVPVTWIAELAYRLGMTDYYAWLLTNVVLTLGSAVICYAAARMLGPKESAIWASTVLLAFPLTTWLTLNVLAEVWIGFLISLLLLGVVATEIRRARWGLFLCAISAGLLYWTRDNFILVALTFLIFCAWLWRRRGWRLSVVLLAGLTSITFLATRALIFPRYPSGGLQAALGTQTSMDFYYGKVDFHVGPFLSKLPSGTMAAVLPSGASELITESLLLLGTVAAIWASRKEARFRLVGALLLCLLVVYLATCAIFQAQNRYIYVLVPIASVAAALAVGRLSSHAGRRSVLAQYLGAAVVLSFLGTSVLLANHYRASAALETQMIATMRSTLSTTQGPLLSTGDSAAVISVAYAAAPRVVVVVEPTINTIDEVAVLVERRRPGVVLGRASDTLFLTRGVQQAFPGTVLEWVGHVPTPGGELQVWEISIPQPVTVE